MTKVFLSLGSNIGDKKTYLESALIVKPIVKTQVRLFHHFRNTAWGKYQDDLTSCELKLVYPARVT